MNKLCSIIIRTKNEERWISSCLSAVFEQTYKNIEVILVDNKSTDRTMEKAKQFPIHKTVIIDKYLPGDALNTGINESTGDYVVCLSGHCIPVNEHWLKNLVDAIEVNDSYAGVYGRQEPMAFSEPTDKRDMLLVFGLDRRVQYKDSFFHNANSILRRSLWSEVPFDKNVTNIEDRLWGQEMLNKGYQLVYEPEASVYHYHGIHQNGNVERCNNVVRIIEDMKNESRESGSLNAKEMNIIAIIPVRGKERLLGGRPQLAYTIEAAKKSKYINQIVVTTDDESTAELARSLGADCPFLRTSELTKDYVGLEAVLCDAVLKLEESGIYPDLIVSLEETFPFRPDGLIDDIIEHTLNEGFDTVLAARGESGSLWQEDEEGAFARLDSGDGPREYKEKSFIGLKGLCCVTHPVFIRQQRLIGNNVGLYHSDSPISALEVRDETDREIAERLLGVCS